MLGKGRPHWKPTVAEELKMLRKNLGMTQKQFTLELGVPLDTLRNWEQNRTNPRHLACLFLRMLEADPVGTKKLVAKVVEQSPQQT